MMAPTTKIVVKDDRTSPIDACHSGPARTKDLHMGQTRWVDKLGLMPQEGVVVEVAPSERT